MPIYILSAITLLIGIVAYIIIRRFMSAAGCGDDANVLKYGDPITLLNLGWDGCTSSVSPHPYLTVGTWGGQPNVPRGVCLGTASGDVITFKLQKCTADYTTRGCNSNSFVGQPVKYGDYMQITSSAGTIYADLIATNFNNGPTFYGAAWPIWKIAPGDPTSPKKDGDPVHANDKVNFMSYSYDTPPVSHQGRALGQIAAGAIDAGFVGPWTTWQIKTMKEGKCLRDVSVNTQAFRTYAGWIFFILGFITVASLLGPLLLKLAA